jgi:hypothetical protein
MRSLSLCYIPATPTTTIVIDLLVFYTLLGVLLCKLYSYTILSTTLTTYISLYYLSNTYNTTISFLAFSKLKKLAKLLANYLCK